MKTIFALVTLLTMSSAFAQQGTSPQQGTSAPMGVKPLDSASGSRHMFEFGADSVLGGLLSFDKSKTKGSDADYDTQLNLDLNYAYALANMPRLQLGSRLLYLKDVNSLGDQENFGFQVGAILNSIAKLEDAAYLSLYLGMLWNNSYEKGGNDDEVRLGTLAVGKRFSMEAWGVKHLVYSPELALTTRNSTTGGSFDYSQDLQVRFLQFSVFF